MRNRTQLITYVDRLGGGGLRDLTALLDGPLAGLFGGVHLLPFFHAIDGADAGFDPIDHTQVDPRLGGWADIKSLTEVVDVMADVIRGGGDAGLRPQVRRRRGAVLSSQVRSGARRSHGQKGRRSKIREGEERQSLQS